jgi:hypothetical protein
MNPQTQSMNEIRALALGELSLKARLGYVGLLLVSAAMATVVISLWWTEPVLPVRTQFAFGAMSLIGTSWMVLAAWALRSRRPLFARDRVIAGRMAIAFTAMFTVGSGIAAVLAGGAAAYGALATGFVMLGVAVLVLRNARKAFETLSARRARLERDLESR